MTPRTIPFLAAVLLAGAARAAAPESPPPAEQKELHRGPDYHGAGGFLLLREFTVVYPAGPGENVELARSSAENRARWLESVTKGRVDVAADDQVTEVQRRGNLLILGWNNRVWGGADFPRPFERTGETLDFLGIKESDSELDLLLFHRNPIDPSHFILFWSRIDPERDRFLPLPRIGSDWALLRDFFPVRQGMLRPGIAWPPARDTQAEGHRRLPGAAAPDRTGVLDSEHYHAVFDRTKFAPDEIRTILKAREAALLRAEAAVGPLPALRIYLMLFEDQAAKRDGTGVAEPSHSLPWAHEIDMVRRYARSDSPHEEVHLLARDAYGPCFLSALYEGLAIAIDGTWRGQDMEMQAAMLKAGGHLPDLATLLDEVLLRALPDDLASAASGVFAAWFRTTYGPAGLKKAYGLRVGTPAALARAVGVTEGALTASWTSWIDARVAARKSDLDFAAAEVDAQKSRTAGDWAGMVEALRRALAAKPKDPQTVFNLASAQMRADDLRGAEASLKGLLASGLGPQDSRFVVYGHYQLGRVYDLEGRRADALREYEAVLALPDDHGSRALATERKGSPATKEQLE
jgi:hypothetical protein